MQAQQYTTTGIENTPLFMSIPHDASMALSRVEKLIIWMRRHNTSFGILAKSLGITRMSVCRLCKAERIPPERFDEFVALGVPKSLLPKPVAVKRGRKPRAVKSHRRSLSAVAGE